MRPQARSSNKTLLNLAIKPNPFGINQVIKQININNKDFINKTKRQKAKSSNKIKRYIVKSNNKTKHYNAKSSNKKVRKLNLANKQNVREAFKKNGQIWELFPIGWVGGRPNPNFLTGF